MYDVLDICKYIVNWFADKNITLTNLKLQKLLYYVQANFLVALGQPCFSDSIEAWALGPVVRRAYNIYCINGNAPLLRDSTASNISQIHRGLIDEILEQLADVSAYNLVNMTHAEKPWISAYDNGNGKYSVITNESILNYFRKLS